MAVWSHLQLFLKKNIFIKMCFFPFRGEKQECKYFDQLVHIFGNKYMLNSDSLSEDAPEVIGEKTGFKVF